MNQDPINQRLKVLVEALGMNVRSFSSKLGISDSTARNYVDRGSKPPADFIATVLSSIEGINPTWLLLGEGRMFLNETKAAAQPLGKKGKASSANPAPAPTTTNTPEDCRRELAVCQRENDMLRSHLQDKERIIQLLERQLER